MRWVMSDVWWDGALDAVLLGMLVNVAPRCHKRVGLNRQRNV